MQDHRCSNVLEDPLIGWQGVSHKGFFMNAQYRPNTVLEKSTFLSRCQEMPRGSLSSSEVPAQLILVPLNLKNETMFPEKEC